MTKPYFTRKNLIALSVAFLYAFVFLFTGYCMAASRSNVIQKFAVDLFGFNMKILKVENSYLFFYF